MRWEPWETRNRFPCPVPNQAGLAGCARATCIVFSLAGRVFSDPPLISSLFDPSHAFHSPDLWSGLCLRPPGNPLDLYIQTCGDSRVFSWTGRNATSMRRLGRVKQQRRFFLSPPFFYLRGEEFLREPQRSGIGRLFEPGQSRTTAHAGDPQGGGSLSCGGSRLQRRLPALFAGGWRASGVGGTRPPRLSPEGKRERGDQIPCAARYFLPHRCSLA
jgi:hypothetical protein